MTFSPGTFPARCGPTSTRRSPEHLAGVGDVRLLDGGLAAWAASGRALEAGPARHPAAAGTVTVRAGGMPAVEAAGAADLARVGILLDARAAARYRGDLRSEE